LFAVACQLSIVAAFCIYNDADRSFIFRSPVDIGTLLHGKGFQKQMSEGTSQCCPFTDKACNPAGTITANIGADVACDNTGSMTSFQLPGGGYAYATGSGGHYTIASLGVDGKPVDSINISC